MRGVVAIGLGTLCLASCCPAIELAPPVDPPVAGQEPDPDVTSPPEPRARRPTLVLAVVIDQLPSWALDRYLEHLPPEGLIRRVVDRGVYVRRVEYDFAVTNTAPGHAAIYTGAAPFESGIAGNQVFDPKRGRHRVIDDGIHAVHGQSQQFASPTMLRVPTVGDALHAQVEGSQVVSVSLKPRAAILSGGQTADAAIWYAPVLGGFTSSAFYGPLPPWVATFNRDHPIRELLVPWEATDTALLGRIAGVDDGAGEGDWHGFGTTFPHDPKATKRPRAVVGATPAMTRQLVDLARVGADALALAEDDRTDLLAVSISGTDVAGHVFGAESWEYVDHLIAADRALGALYDHLGPKGEVAVLITADHGVHPLVERQPEGTAFRIFPDELVREADRIVDGVLGPGEWVEGFVKPWLVFRASLQNHRRRGAAEAALKKQLLATPGIAEVFARDEAAAMREDPDFVRRAIGRSVVEGGFGDLFVLPDELSVFDERHPAGKGTGHGTPYRSDREVPVMFMGPGIAPAVVVEPLAQARVAATLAALLGVRPPAAATAPPLPGIDPAR